LPDPRLAVFRPLPGLAGIAMELFPWLFGDLLTFVYHRFGPFAIPG
jgi:hypothetical protein